MFGLFERLQAIERNTERILAMLGRLEGQANKTQNLLIMNEKELQDLQAAVANDASVEQSAITLLNGLSAQLKQIIASNGDLPSVLASVESLAGTLDGNSASLAAAVLANTPTAPASSGTVANS